MTRYSVRVMRTHSEVEYANIVVEAENPLEARDEALGIAEVGDDDLNGEVKWTDPRSAGTDYDLTGDAPVRLDVEAEDA